MQIKIDIRQDETSDGNQHIGEANVLNFAPQELDERACRSEQELIKGSLNEIFLHLPEVPEKQAVKAVSKQP